MMSRRIKSGTLLSILCLCLCQVCSADYLSDLARPHQGRSMRATSTYKLGDNPRHWDGQPDPNHNLDNSVVQPGETKVLMDVEGPGVITHIWMTFLGTERHPWAKDGAANHQEMLLRMYWDGSDRPAVEAPVGDFFANSFGKRSEVVSLPVIVEDADSYNCFWHMPFRKSAKVEIVNQSDKPIGLLYFNIDWVKKNKIGPKAPYFYAQYRQEYPVENGKDYVVLDTEGKGHFVGTVLSVRTRSPSWFGEGDEKIYIDGEEKASIWGTGTEDYFLSAWGLKTTSTPYFGVPYFDQWGIVGGHTSAYRWHVTDPIIFNTGIKVTFEHMGWMSPDENPDYKEHSWNEREDDYSSVAFWYQTGRPTFTARAPHAKERTLPCLDTILVGKDFTADRYHGRGEARSQYLDVHLGEHLLFKGTDQENAWLEIPFEIQKKEPKRLLLVLTKADDFGIYQASLNGVKLGGPIDLYSQNIEAFEQHLLDFWPEPGKYTLRLECVGQNKASAGYYLGLESARLRQRRPRVVEFGHDKDKNWQEKPVLYN